MKKIKLYQLFVKLSKWDKNHFEEFLHSPYFNKRKDVIRLFDFLNTSSSKILNGNDYQLAYRYVYPEKKFIEKDAYLLFSYLYKLLETFMAYQYLGQDKAQLKFFTAKFYRTLKMDQPFRRKIEEARIILDKTSIRNNDYLRWQYNLENELYDYLGGSRRTIENNLEMVGSAFDVYYISEKIRLYCFQLSHQVVFDKTYSSDFSKEVIQFVETHTDYLQYPPIAIYYNYYQALFHEKSIIHFLNFRKKIEELKQHFSPVEIRDIYLAAINVCIKRVNKGGRKYREEMFDLYKNIIDQKVLLENDQISRYIFTNIVTISIKLNKLNWLEEFIKKYKSKLNPKIRENTVKYATGALRYEQKNYKQAIRLLSSVELDDHLLMLNTKNIQLRIYYELGEYEALETHLDSMRQYLKRKETIGYHKELYLEVINLTKKLITLPPYDHKKREKLYRSAEKARLQSFKTWLLKQLSKGQGMGNI